MPPSRSLPQTVAPGTNSLRACMEQARIAPSAKGGYRKKDCLAENHCMPKGHVPKSRFAAKAHQRSRQFAKLAQRSRRTRVLPRNLALTENNACQKATSLHGGKGTAASRRNPRARATSHCPVGHVCSELSDAASRRNITKTNSAMFEERARLSRQWFQWRRPRNIRQQRRSVVFAKAPNFAEGHSRRRGCTIPSG